VVLLEALGGLLLLALWLFCLVDVIVTDESSCRNLPKMVWLVIVLVLPDVGSILWLIAGRPQSVAAQGAARYRRSSGAAYREAPRSSNPDDDEEFLRSVRQRAEEQRRTAREQQDRRERRDDEPTT
jgi:hypothetical protein